MRFFASLRMTNKVMANLFYDVLEVNPVFALLEQALNGDTPATKEGPDLSTV